MFFYQNIGAYSVVNLRKWGISESFGDNIGDGIQGAYIDWLAYRTNERAKIL